MSLTSNAFIIFLAACLLLYYVFPKKLQWAVLLAASWFFYLAGGARVFIFLIYSTAIAWGVGLYLKRCHAKAGDHVADAKAHCAIVLGIVLDLLMLGILKYTDFVIGIMNQVGGINLPMLRFLLPLGISYYTFQTIGYMLDVYWKRAEAETNFFKFALFVSFFPQLAQGPIGKYGKLAPQLYAEHSFSFRNICYGLMRIVWGLFKSVLLAGWAGIYRQAIFANFDQYAGIAIFGVLLYSIEIYGSFSGGIDIALGVSQMFGITLDENFQRPFFSTSISNFWQRWHITLGTWMRDYVFFPLFLSRGMRKIGRKTKKMFGKRIGLVLPECLCSLIVFFLVGIWHGASWNNVGWGLYNAVIIAFSQLMANVYVSWKKHLCINDKSKGWHLFMIVRTFILTNIGWYFDCTSSFGQALTMMRDSVTKFEPSLFLQISAGKQGTTYTPYALLILLLGIALLFLVSLLQENGWHIRDRLSAVPVVLQFVICIGLLTVTGLFSPMAAARGFIYAQF